MKISSLLSFLLGFHGFRMFNDDPGSTGGNITPAAPVKPETFSKEYVHELREENKSWRTKHNEGQTAYAVEKARADAAEVARDAAKAEAQKEADARVMRAELKSVALKHGIVDLKGLALLDLTGLKMNADGELEGADALFEAAKTASPWLFGSKNTGSTNAPPEKKPVVPVDVRKADQKDYDAAKAAYLKKSR